MLNVQVTTQQAVALIKKVKSHASYNNLWWALNNTAIELLMPTGAKLKKVGKEYFLCGYACDGSDVTKLLSKKGGSNHE